MSDTLTPERFVPAAMHGQLIEAEHLVRYWWASRLAEGKRVLDAGCGTAYGTRMLASAGAAQVTGVDRATSVLDAAREHCPPEVELVTGDVRALPFEDRSFDLVVCFEVIEHLDDPEATLRELERVVTTEGIVLVSSPNRDVYEPGNPHHVHEYVPGELREALERSFAHVELRRQANLIASSVMPADVAATEAFEPLDDLRFAKCVALPADGETYTLAMASHSPLDLDPSTTMVATGITELRRWLELYDGQQRILVDQDAQVRKARFDAEQAHARMLKVADELNASRTESELLRREIAALKERLDRSAAAIKGMQESPSWRITAPLRALKRRRGR